jgi:hypothetical protein
MRKSDVFEPLRFIVAQDANLLKAQGPRSKVKESKGAVTVTSSCDAPCCSATSFNDYEDVRSHRASHSSRHRPANRRAVSRAWFQVRDKPILKDSLHTRTISVLDGGVHADGLTANSLVVTDQELHLFLLSIIYICCTDPG